MGKKHTNPNKLYKLARIAANKAVLEDINNVLDDFNVYSDNTKEKINSLNITISESELGLPIIKFGNPNIIKDILLDMKTKIEKNLRKDIK